MNRPLRWAVAILGGAAVLACALVAVVYLATEPLLRRAYDAPLRPIAVPQETEAIAEGQRLAAIRGCFDGCHGQGVSGAVFWEEPWVARVVAPELTRVFSSHSDAELERVIRRGVRQDGSSVWVMPSNMFHHLSDADLGRIIAFIRSLPPGDGMETEVWFGPLGRLMLLLDPWPPMAQEIASDAPWATAAELEGEGGLGRYLALTVCTECHGMDLAGAADGTAPNLVVAAAYSQEQFARLMRTGKPIGDRELNLMALVARERFSRLTDAEVGALYAHLQARTRGTE
jgi:cytochrome c553